MPTHAYPVLARPLRAAALALASALLLGAPALAQAPTPAPADEEAVEAVEDDFEAYERALEHYKAARHAEALRWMTRAHRLAPEDARYVYNIGRLEQELGRYADAVASFERVLAFPAADEEFTALARTQLEALRPLAQQAVLVVSSVAEGAVVQLDGEALPDPGQERPVAPGAHQLCIIAPDGALATCWQRDLARGVRTTFPWPASPSTRARVVWTELPGATGLRVNGHALLATLDRLRAIEIDVGRHEVGIRYATPDDPELIVTIDLAPQQEHTLQGRPAPAPEPSLPPEPAASPSEEAAPGPSGAPWVVFAAGAVLAGAGGGLVASGAAQRDAVLGAKTIDDDGDTVVTGLTQIEARGMWEAGNDKTTAGVVLLSIGGAVAAGGLVWGLIDALSSGGEEAAEVWVAPSPTGAVAVGGRF